MKCSFIKNLHNSFEITYHIGQIYLLNKQASLLEEKWNFVMTLQESLINMNANFSSSALQKSTPGI